MRVIIDDKIPYIREAITPLVDEAIFLPGDAIDAPTVRNADALIIRTRTRCDANLLAGSKVKFIATATIGFDHIDTAYCKKQGIQWTNAPGCNAPSVCQYLQSVLLLLEKERHVSLQQSTLGVIGVGHVGTLVAEMAEALGMRVLRNDPPRRAAGEKGFTDLTSIMQQADIITIHTPLIRTGEYSTFHLADKTFFESLKKKPYLINTSRGETVDTEAILYALQKGLITDAIIDVWEHEPQINRELLQASYIGTPHIAGYSADGKANATRMSLESLTQFFHLRKPQPVEAPAPTCNTICARSIKEALLKIYNPHTDSLKLKARPEDFEFLRNHYPLRREAKAFHIQIDDSVDLP